MIFEDSSSVELSDYRVIVYPASRPFTPKESKTITEKIYDFLGSWAAHGKPLTSSFKIERNQFIVVCVDEDIEAASGCSIDSLGGVIRTLEEEFQLGFFDRMKASFVESGEVKTLNLKDFRAGIKNNTISRSIQVFDFSKNSYLSFTQDFLLPLDDSWANIYI